MKFIVTFLMIFSLIMGQFQSFSIIFIKWNNTLNAPDTGSSNEPETEVETVLDDTTSDNVVDDTIIELNNTLDLDGYCTIRIPSKYFTVINDESNFTRKVIRYKDKKTRLIMSYVRNMDMDADIPGYIVREAAGVNIVTNSKHDVEYNSGTWTVVPADKPIDGMDTTVYYIANQDITEGDYSAFWIRANVYPDMTDDEKEEFNEVLTAMLNSYNMYYLGNPIFEVPTTGYYADNKVDSDTIADTTDYKANNQEHTVFQTDNVGYNYDVNISANWMDMQISIDDHLIKLPCELQDLYDAGFIINDLKVTNDQITIMNGTSIEYQVSNENGTVMKITSYNSSKVDRKTLYECEVVKLDIDTSEFVAVVDEKEQDQQTEEAETFTETDEPSDGTEESKESDYGAKIIDEEGQSDIVVETEPTTETTEENEMEPTTESETATEYEEHVDNLGQEPVKQSYDNLVIGHNIVLAGGVTLNIYNTDLIAQYGTVGLTENANNGMMYYTWKKDNLVMQLACGAVKNIKHIVLSTVGE